MTTCVTLFDYQLCGGGGIRTPGACARRFSRPLPSTARPLLQAVPEAGRIYRDQSRVVKLDLPFSLVSRTYVLREVSGARRSRPPTYGRSAAGMTTEPSACWYCSMI